MVLTIVSTFGYRLRSAYLLNMVLTSSSVILVIRPSVVAASPPVLPREVIIP
jgi:hypothetical protein